MKYLAKRIFKEYTIPAGGSVSDEIVVDFVVSRVNVLSKGADVTVSLTFEGKSYSDSFSVVSDFGYPCVGVVAISASNAGAEDEGLSIEVLGAELWQR